MPRLSKKPAKKHWNLRDGLIPSERLRWTKAGWGYIVFWLGLLLTGLYHQLNLYLLVAGFAAGPLVASILASGAMLRGLRIQRRAPAYVFSGDQLAVEYALENNRRAASALAVIVSDELSPVEFVPPAAGRQEIEVSFDRVPPRERLWLRWQGPSPSRGRYQFANIDLVTRSPFGLLERRVRTPSDDELIVYPRVGRVTRRWNQLFRESTETRRGRRTDRTMRQEDYHGLREYRPGDSPRWIHWRTTARFGKPMVKEFEHENHQDLALLIDPWLPRSKVTADQREILEQVIRFAATICLETCRHPGRRILLGWTGLVPGLRQGPAAVKLLHQLLEQLAVMKPTHEGHFSSLIDLMPTAMLRDALVVAVSTRPINLTEEAERSSRLSAAWGRNMASYLVLLDASRGELDGLVDLSETSSREARSRKPLDSLVMDELGEPPVKDQTGDSQRSHASEGSNGQPDRSDAFLPADQTGETARP
jgi:uncharacterized protein (DUF58 family)